MNPDIDIRRGQEASRVLESEVYKEAFAVIESRLSSELFQVEIKAERAEYLRQLIAMNRKVRSYLEQVMVTGQMGEEHKSLIDRAKDSARHFLR